MCCVSIYGYVKLCTYFAIRPEDSVKKSCVSVTDVMDIEENIWSPRYTGPTISIIPCEPHTTL